MQLTFPSPGWVRFWRKGQLTGYFSGGQRDLNLSGDPWKQVEFPITSAGQNLTLSCHYLLGWIDQLEFVPSHSFAAWSVAAGLRPDAHADPDTDGIANLLEYGFGLDPAQPNKSIFSAPTASAQPGLPQQSWHTEPDGTRRLQLAFWKPRGSQVRYTLQAADTLRGPWLAQPAASIQVSRFGSEWEFIQSQDSQPYSPLTPTRFLRLHLQP